VGHSGKKKKKKKKRKGRCFLKGQGNGKRRKHRIAREEKKQERRGIYVVAEKGKRKNVYV